MFAYSHANTPLGQSERTYYLSYYFINNADVRKGGDLLKLFEQSNLVNNNVFFDGQITNCKRSKVEHLHLQIVYELFLLSCLLDYCVITRIFSCMNLERGQSPTLSRASCVTVHLIYIHADYWLFTEIIVTLTNACMKTCFVW